MRLKKPTPHLFDVNMTSSPLSRSQKPNMLSATSSNHESANHSTLDGFLLSYRLSYHVCYNVLTLLCVDVCSVTGYILTLKDQHTAR